MSKRKARLNILSFQERILLHNRLRWTSGRHTEIMLDSDSHTSNNRLATKELNTDSTLKQLWQLYAVRQQMTSKSRRAIGQAWTIAHSL